MTIGMGGGIGPESTVDYYRLLLARFREHSRRSADLRLRGLRLEWSPRRRCCILAACRAALRDRPFVSDRFFFVTVRLLKRRRELDDADFQ